MKYDYHPASNIYRLMDKEERGPMRDSIREFGQQEPITIYKNLILDGRNRYLCCQELKVDPWVQEITDNDLDGLTPVRYVVIKNEHRRHDDLAERQLAAGRMVLALEAEGKERKGQNLKKGRETPESTKLSNRGSAKEIAAAACGVSEQIAQSSANLQKTGAADVIEAVENKEVSLSDAAAVADLPKSDQKAALKKVKAGKARTMKAAVKELEPKHQSGKQTFDVRPFERLEKHLGAALRMGDDLHKKNPAAKFHRDYMARVKDAMRELEDWRKAVRR